MKKLLIFMLVLGIGSVANAGTVALEVVGGDDPVGGSYKFSDIITIGLVGSGFSAGPTAFFSLVIETATTDKGGTSSSPDLHTFLKGSTPYYVGTVVNSGGVLIETVQGTGAVGAFDGVPNGETAWWFDFHVPDVPDSTIINIALTGVVVKGAFGAVQAESATPLAIHVVPEPMTVLLLGLGGLFLRRRK